MIKKITENQIFELYDILKSIYNDEKALYISNDETITKEINDRVTYDWNISSLKMYIQAFRAMLKGEEFKRSINNIAKEHFLKKIGEDFTSKEFENAKKALELHEIYMKKSKNEEISTEENYIEVLKNENLKLTGKLQKLVEKFDKREKDFESLNQILEKSESLESDFNNAKETVLKDLKIEEPVKYWEGQVKSYSLKYWMYLLAVVVVSAILLIMVFDFLESNPLTINGFDLNSTIEHNISVATDKVNKTFKLWEYGFLILATSMCIWLIKILVKIMLSNYHLSVDAKERVIMIRTYLALLKEGSGYKEEDKKVMLDNIFRPTNFGIIKDETSVTIADLISSFKSK